MRPRFFMISCEFLFYVVKFKSMSLPGITLEMVYIDKLMAILIGSDYVYTSLLLFTGHLQKADFIRSMD